MTSTAAPRLKWHMLRRKSSDPAFLRENLRAALLAGAACEVDIVLTKDGEAFCLHDLSLDRETTGTGLASAATRAQVERLRQRGPDGRVLESPPLFLDEIVDIVREMGARAPGPRSTRYQGSSRGDRRRMPYGGSDRCWATGLPHSSQADTTGPRSSVSPMRRRDCVAGSIRSPSIPAIARWTPMRFAGSARRPLATAPDADIFYLEARLVLAGLDRGVNLIEMVTGRGAMVDCWTLDAARPRLRDDVTRLLQAGCTQITTNDPDALSAVIKELVAVLTAASPEPGRLVTATVERLDLPSLNARQAILDAAITPESFARAFADQPVLHAVEVRHPAIPARPGREARIVFWNAERLKYLDHSIAMLSAFERRRARPVRSRCRHGPLGRQAHDRRPRRRDVGRASCLGWSSWSWAWATSGSAPSSRARTIRPGCMARGSSRRAALHRPALVRLETSGRWFDGAFHERRVGGRIAMLAEIDLAGVPVLLVSAHYESHSDPADRLPADDNDARRHRPPLAGEARAHRRRFQHQHVRPREEAGRRACPASPGRGSGPPRGAHAVRTDVRAAGRARLRLGAPATCPSPTRSGRGRTAPRSRPSARSTGTSREACAAPTPRSLPAVDAEGTAISDHEALAVTITPA